MIAIGSASVSRSCRAAAQRSRATSRLGPNSRRRAPASAGVNPALAITAGMAIPFAPGGANLAPAATIRAAAARIATSSQQSAFQPGPDHGTLREFTGIRR